MNSRVVIAGEATGWFQSLVAPQKLRLELTPETKLAEAVGFEPTVPVKVQRFSSRKKTSLMRQRAILQELAGTATVRRFERVRFLLPLH